MMIPAWLTLHSTGTAGRGENGEDGQPNLEQAAVVHIALLHICQVTVGRALR